MHIYYAKIYLSPKEAQTLPSHVRQTRSAQQWCYRARCWHRHHYLEAQLQSKTKKQTNKNKQTKQTNKKTDILVS